MGRSYGDRLEEGFRMLSDECGSEDCDVDAPVVLGLDEDGEEDEDLELLDAIGDMMSRVLHSDEEYCTITREMLDGDV